MIIVKGQPRGKGRPRFTRYGHAYTDPKTREYENQIQKSFIESRQVMLDGYISLEIKAYYGIPKATSKKVREQMLNGNIIPVVKPDIDNIAKVVLDALNKFLYKDDNQVVKLSVEKHYSNDPRIEIYY